MYWVLLTPKQVKELRESKDWVPVKTKTTKDMIRETKLNAPKIKSVMIDGEEYYVFHDKRIAEIVRKHEEETDKT